MASAFAEHKAAEAQDNFSRALRQKVVQGWFGYVRPSARKELMTKVEQGGHGILDEQESGVDIVGCATPRQR